MGKKRERQWSLLIGMWGRSLPLQRRIGKRKANEKSVSKSVMDCRDKKAERSWWNEEGLIDSDG